MLYQDRISMKTNLRLITLFITGQASRSKDDVTSTAIEEVTRESNIEIAAQGKFFLCRISFLKLHKSILIIWIWDGFDLDNATDDGEPSSHCSWERGKAQ